MSRILKISGTKIELEIVSCDSVYRPNKPDIPGCPFFDDGCGFEYAARCQLVDANGDSLMGLTKPTILPICPLPEKRRKK